MIMGMAGGNEVNIVIRAIDEFSKTMDSISGN